MTPRQARRVTRSLRFRRELWQDVPKLESELRSYVKRNADISQPGKKVARLGNFEVILEDDVLDIKCLNSSIPDSQKEFEFLQEVSQ